MKERSDFKKGSGFHWLIMLLLAITIAISGISRTAMAASVLVNNGGPPAGSTTSNIDITGDTISSTSGTTIYVDDNLNVSGTTTIGGAAQLNNSLHVNDGSSDDYATFWVDTEDWFGQSVGGKVFFNNSLYTGSSVFGASQDFFRANSYYQDSSESFSSDLYVDGLDGVVMNHVDSNNNYAQLSLTTNPEAYGSGYGEGAYIGYWNYDAYRDFGTLAKPDSVSIGRWQWDEDVGVIESFNGITITDTDTTITGATYMDSDGTGTAGSTFSLTNDGASLLSSTGHGLTIGADSTTLSGGTSSSEWILADGQADLSVDGTQVFVATNSGTATDIKISSDTLTVGAATTINNTLDVTGLTTTAGISNTGNLSSRSTNTSFGLDVNDTVAQLGYQSGTLTNGVQATAGGLVLSSTDTAAYYSSTVRLDGSQAYISYNDGTFESGLEAGPAGLIVGSSAGATSLGMTTNISTNEVIVGYMSGTQAYGLHADNDEVNVGYLNGTDDFHGLTVTNSQTTLSGGTNSSSLTLADNVATLAVGTATEGEIDLLTATNNGGGATNVTIGNTANNYLEVDSTTGTTVHGNLTITGNLSVNGTTFSGNNISTNGDITAIGTIEGGTITDGTATMTGGALTGLTSLSVDSNGTSANGNRLVVDTTNIRMTSNAGSQLIVGNAANGIRAYSANDNAEMGVNNNSAYIGYNGYGLDADSTSVNVGYDNGSTFHGLTVTDDTTTLSGGTMSSVWTLADGQADLSVDGEQVFIATNSSGTTTVNIAGDINNIGNASSTNTILGTTNVTGDTNINTSGSGLTTIGNADSLIHLNGATTINNTLDVNGATILGNTLTVAGATTLNDTLHVVGAATLDSTLDVAGATTLNDTLDVTGATTLNDTLHVVGAATLDSTLDVAGATTLNDTLDVTGATTLNDTLHVVGAATLDSTLDVADDLTATGTTNTIGTAGVSTNTITGVDNFITATNSNTMGVTGGSAVTTTATRVTALTADGSGLTINNGGTVALKNSVGNDGYGPGHGLTIHPDNTVLSGGTTSTTLTLNNTGAAFANTATGGPARVTGVADGVYPYDAVNVSQLNGLKKDIERAYAGVASISALSAIPATAAGKRFAIGAGYGYFEGENAIAIGVKARLGENFNIQAGVGVGVDNLKDSTYSANAGFSFSF